MNTQAEKIASLVKPTIEALGFEYWGLVYQTQGRRGLLRIFIDAPQGVTIDDCAKVSRQLNSLLDVENPIHAAYVLEVSSPGMDRLLFEAPHFKRYVGKEITVKLYESLEGRRNFSGTLEAFTDDQVIELNTTDKKYLLPLSKVQTAQVGLAQFLVGRKS